MRRLARAVLACTSLVTTLTVSAPPARALGAGAVVLTGGFVFPAAQTGQGTATFWATGSYNGPVVATFGYLHDQGLCPFAERIAGRFSGAFNAEFTWTRLGAVAVMEVMGDLFGPGFGQAAYSDPTPEVCSGPSVETVVMEIAGLTGL